MKPLQICLTLILVIPIFVQAQITTKKFGEISQKEINMATYPEDTSAEAVVLFDLGNVKFLEKDNGYNIKFVHTKRIKILKRTGIEYSKIEIPYYISNSGESEIVKSIEAYTYYQENGRTMKKALNQSSIFEETKTKNWKVMKFTFPDVNVGSVIEYKYVLISPFLFNLPDWSFQDRIPTYYSEYIAALIPFYEYTFIAQGIKNFDYRNSYVDSEKRTWGNMVETYGQNVGSGVEFQDMVHTYAMKNVPAFKDESYITSPDDYIMKIDFQLSRFHAPHGGTNEIMTTWPELCKELLKHEKFGKYIKSTSNQANKILKSELDLSNKDNTEKSQMIIEYVRSHYTWNGRSSKYSSKKVKNFIKEKSGNSADINLFLIGMLREAGIDAQPVILSTRDHGKIKINYPFDHFFNYVVALVKTGKNSFLTDGTLNTLAFNKIPPRCINDKGLIVDPDKPNWAKLDTNPISTDSKTIHIKIDQEQLVANTKVTIQSTEFDAYWYKNSFDNDTTKIKKEMLGENFSSIDKISTENYRQNNQPYIISIQGESQLERLGNKLIISPFLNFPIKENKLKQKSRSYPVDFIYSMREEYQTDIEIPTNYKVTSIPDNYIIDDDLASIQVLFTKTEKRVMANASYTLKKSTYQPDDYAQLKKELDTIIRKFNEQIIFEKI